MNKKIRKLSDLNQIDGKLEKEDENGKFVATTIEQVLGFNPLSKYGVNNREEYVREIDSKNTAELRTHAVSLGLLPNANSDRLKKQLLLAFDRYMSSYQKPEHIDKNTTLSKKKLNVALKIMSAIK